MVQVEVRAGSGEALSVAIAGTATVVFEATIELPERSA